MIKEREEISIACYCAAQRRSHAKYCHTYRTKAIYAPSIPGWYSFGPAPNHAPLVEIHRVSAANLCSPPPTPFCPIHHPHIPPCPRMALKCFSTASFASKNLSTQFCMHGSSFLSRLLDEMPPVTHFFQHMSVSSWTAGRETGR